MRPSDVKSYLFAVVALGVLSGPTLAEPLYARLSAHEGEVHVADFLREVEASTIRIRDQGRRSTALEGSIRRFTDVQHLGQLVAGENLWAQLSDPQRERFVDIFVSSTADIYAFALQRAPGDRGDMFITSGSATLANGCVRVSVEVRSMVPGMAETVASPLEIDVCRRSMTYDIVATRFVLSGVSMIDAQRAIFEDEMKKVQGDVGAAFKALE